MSIEARIAGIQAELDSLKADHEAAQSQGSGTVVKDWTTFGSDPYAREELVAEMGAAMLCGLAGIENATIDNSAAYIKDWLDKISEDRKLVIQAAAAAQKASDFILDTQFEDHKSD